MNGSPDDDERWLDALAGRAPAGQQGVAGLEAARLRAALQQLDAAPTQALGAEAEQALLDQLLAQAAAAPKAGLCPGCRRRWAALLDGLLARPVWSAALAGLGLWFAVGLWQTPAEDTGAPIERALPDARILLLSDAQPRQRRDELARQLAGAGAKVRRYERLGRFGLDAQFPQPLSSDATRRLAELKLGVDADGVLRLEIEEARP
jgi:hypothetical protein